MERVQNNVKNNSLITNFLKEKKSLALLQRQLGNVKRKRGVDKFQTIYWMRWPYNCI